MKFLVMGLGSIGLRHAQNLLAMGHEVYGYDIDKGVLAGAVERGVKWWESQDVDACVIATPTACHAMDIQRAAKRGWPTFVEKPIAASMDELANVDTGHVLMVGNMLRFRGCAEIAKEWLSAKIEEAYIGEPRCAVFILAQRNTRYSDDVILNWGAHEIDLALYLLGPAKVAACIASHEIADIVLRHENGCQSSIHLDYVGIPESRDFTIMGDKGCISVDLIFGSAKAATQISGGVLWPKDTFDDAYVAEMQAFIDRINGKENQGATAEDGLATLKIIDEARRMAA